MDIADIAVIPLDPGDEHRNMDTTNSTHYGHICGMCDSNWYPREGKTWIELMAIILELCDEWHTELELLYEAYKAIIPSFQLGATTRKHLWI
jgi:hypothetical protein